MTPEISIVVPVFNESESLPTLAREIHAALEPLGRSYEVLFVDDASTDSSPAVLADLRRADERVFVLRMPARSGQSAALLAGFRAARGKLVVTLDGDLQNDPADIPRLLDALGDHDVVSGVRQRRQDDWRRKVASRVANWARRKVLDDGVHDVGCSLKVYRAELLANLPTVDCLHRFLPAVIRMEGGSVIELPVSHRPRLYGETKYTIGGRFRRGIQDLRGMAWLRSRWIPSRTLAARPLAEGTGEESSEESQRD